MNKLAKTLLVLAIVCTVVGGVINLDWVRLGEITGFYAILPCGPVFFGMFLIVHVFENETTDNSEDQHLSDPASTMPPKQEPAVAGKY